MAQTHTIVTYVQTEFRTFRELPFGEVDSLALSALTYMLFEGNPVMEYSPQGVAIQELCHAEHYQAMLHNRQSPDQLLLLLTGMAASPRFRGMRLYHYSTEKDLESGKQFAAVTYQLLPRMVYVAFRGTDASFAGWKEDFNMCLAGTVPSQERALVYLEEMCKRFVRARVYVGGHSKGGNLAVFAAAHCRSYFQKRIDGVFSHDGPGFKEEELTFEGYERIRSRIHKTIPQSSLIGLVLQQESEYSIIRSSNSGGFSQHDPYSWEVGADGHFIYRDKLTVDGELLYKKVNNWVYGLSQEERKKFFGAVFDILEETGAESFKGFGSNWQQNLPAMIHAFGGMDKETQKFLMHTILLLVTTGFEE